MSNALSRVGAPLSAGYEIARVLGEGPRATVFEARTAGGEVVSIKVFSKAFSEDAMARRALSAAQAEARHVAHPGIIPVLDQGETDDGLLFLVMRLDAGETAHERATRAGGRLRVAEVVSIAHGLLRPLSAIHADGLAHGRVKPTNVFLTRDGAIRLLDLGQSERAPGGLGEDVFAVGATLLSLLGGPLLKADNHEFAPAGDPAMVLAAVAPDLPPAVASVIVRSLASDTAGRWANAGAMAEALLSAASACGPASEPPALSVTEAESSSDIGTAATVDARQQSTRQRRSASGVSRTPDLRNPGPHVRGSVVAAARVGTTLADKYRLVELLGEGGTAAVYSALHRNGHRFAVKVLHPWIAADERARERFLREGYVANSIAHPGVVRVADDCVLGDGTSFLVMEILDGDTLSVHVEAKGGRLPPAEVIALSVQLLDVLAKAHELGVVHRDIKPANLFLTTAGELKVLDFGLARLDEPESVSDTRTGAVMGTPAFMAPEQALGQARDISERTDLWGVGATMFKLLTGEYVHQAPTAEATRVYAGSRAARKIRAVTPDVPLDLAEVVDRSLSFEQAERWPTAFAMRDALLSIDTSASSPLRRVLTPPPRSVDQPGAPETAAGISTARPYVLRLGRAASPRRRWHGPALAAAAFATAGLIAFGVLHHQASAPALRQTATTAATEAPPPAATATATATAEDLPSPPPSEPAPNTPPADRATHPSTAASAVPSARPVRAKPPSSAPRRADDPCDPPYVVDSAGRHRYKAECLVH